MGNVTASHSDRWCVSRLLSSGRRLLKSNLISSNIIYPTSFYFLTYRGKLSITSALTFVCVCVTWSPTPRWMCVNWLFCHNFNRTRQSIERKLPLGEWEESVFSYRKRKTEREREGEADRQTKIDMTSHSYFQLCHFDQLTFLFSDVESLSERKPKLWHSENISQTSSVYFRIMLQEISPHTESEVMTHERSVPVQYRNLNTPLL